MQNPHGIHAAQHDPVTRAIEDRVFCNRQRLSQFDGAVNRDPDIAPLRNQVTQGTFQGVGYRIALPCCDYQLRFHGIGERSHAAGIAQLQSNRLAPFRFEIIDDWHREREAALGGGKSQSSCYR